MIGGELQFQTNEGVQKYSAGHLGLIRRNQLTKAIKMPAANGQPFTSISIFLPQDFLRAYSQKHTIGATGVYKGAPMLLLKNDAFIKGFFNSLIPYFDAPDELTADLAALKTEEAIALLLRHDETLKELLFDFQAPHKIDLEAFMNRHFMYNVTMGRFATLTGRSLATFKRDFQKQFATSPEKWLHHKRLEYAHYLLTQKKQKPSEVYLEVGFENLSHFSTAFKQEFGYSPSSIQ
jgi:AraC-like DNA-binding protein